VTETVRLAREMYAEKSTGTGIPPTSRRGRTRSRVMRRERAGASADDAGDRVKWKSRTRAAEPEWSVVM